jgi:hypothetical protein
MCNSPKNNLGANYARFAALRFGAFLAALRLTAFFAFFLAAMVVAVSGFTSK